MEKTQVQIRQQYEAIRNAVHKNYSIEITDDRDNQNDYEGKMRRDSTNTGLNELLKYRKRIAKSLADGNLIETQESLDLFDHLNKKILQYLNINV